MICARSKTAEGPRRVRAPFVQRRSEERASLMDAASTIQDAIVRSASDYTLHNVERVRGDDPKQSLKLIVDKLEAPVGLRVAAHLLQQCLLHSEMSLLLEPLAIWAPKYSMLF
jgi:hypothetical protein